MLDWTMNTPKSEEEERDYWISLEARSVLEGKPELCKFCEKQEFQKMRLQLESRQHALNLLRIEKDKVNKRIWNTEQDINNNNTVDDKTDVSSLLLYEKVLQDDYTDDFSSSTDEEDNVHDSEPEINLGSFHEQSKHPDNVLSELFEGCQIEGLPWGNSLNQIIGNEKDFDKAHNPNKYDVLLMQTEKPTGHQKACLIIGGEVAINFTGLEKTRHVERVKKHVKEMNMKFITEDNDSPFAPTSLTQIGTKPKLGSKKVD